MKIKYELEPGDKFKVVDEKVEGVDWEIEGKMDKWLGKVMTVRAVDKIEPFSYSAEEDRGECLNNGWYWFENMINWKATIKLNEVNK